MDKRFERRLVAETRQKLQEAMKRATDGREFTSTEMDRALGELPTEKAAGPDDIPNEFLSHLGPKGRELLRRLFSASLLQVVTPPLGVAASPSRC